MAFPPSNQYTRCNNSVLPEQPGKKGKTVQAGLRLGYQLSRNCLQLQRAGLLGKVQFITAVRLLPLSARHPDAEQWGAASAHQGWGLARQEVAKQRFLRDETMGSGS